MNENKRLLVIFGVIVLVVAVILIISFWPEPDKTFTCGVKADGDYDKLGSVNYEQYQCLYESDDKNALVVADELSNKEKETLNNVATRLGHALYYVDTESFSSDELKSMKKELKYNDNSFDKNVILTIQSEKVDDFKEDLTSSVCMLVKDGLNYRFIHRSFQEYFAAWYTCKLTDKDQYDLLTDWISRSSSCVIDEYMSMLFDFQKEKVNKIIFCPGIEQLKYLYDKYGFSCDLLRELFNGVKISTVYSGKDNSKNTYLNLSLNTKNEYLCHIERLVCCLNSYPFSKGNIIDPKTQELPRKMLNSIKKPHSYKWTFDEVLTIVSPEQLLESLQWFDRQLHFCFALYERYNKNLNPGKRTMASILDEL